ncbi:MAG: hypothetical protein ACE5JD_03855 [Candidatus Methylomirabilia bacterium]
MQELIAFAHGMGNFAHNRGTKEEQERLIRDHPDAGHRFLGAFDDSGNFAFATSRDMEELQADVLAALNVKYEVEGVVIIAREGAARALATLEGIARSRYGSKFRLRDYAVSKECKRWRLGFVFIDQEAGLSSVSIDELESLSNEDVEVLSVHEGIVGVLKFDQGKRIPWGEPAGTVAGLLGRMTPRLLATGRSARTVRGVLRKFPQPSHGRKSRSPLV